MNNCDLQKLIITIKLSTLIFIGGNFRCFSLFTAMNIFGHALYYSTVFLVGIQELGPLI